MKSYRVDNIPVLARPLYLFLAHVAGLAIFTYYLVCHLTCRIRFEGERSFLEDGKNKIYCLWHTDWWPYLAVSIRVREPQIWLNHPAAYMKPIHVALRMTGVKKLILGSQGEEGRRAVDELVEYLRSGFSTAISPDGPGGPPRVLKKGVLHLAFRSGLPVLPLTIVTTRCLRVKSWDSKRIPLPFSTIRVIVHRPVAVDEGNWNEAGEQITRQLNSTGRS